MSIISFLEENMLRCFWKSAFGIDCLGCGLQRSVIFLLKGEFSNAFHMYPPIYTLLIMFVFLIFHLKLNFKYGHKILIGLFISNVLIMILNFSLKNL